MKLSKMLFLFLCLVPILFFGQNNNDTIYIIMDSTSHNFVGKDTLFIGDKDFHGTKYRNTLDNEKITNDTIKTFLFIYPNDINRTTMFSRYSDSLKKCDEKYIEIGERIQCYTEFESLLNVLIRPLILSKYNNSSQIIEPKNSFNKECKVAYKTCFNFTKGNNFSAFITLINYYHRESTIFLSDSSDDKNLVFEKYNFE